MSTMSNKITGKEYPLSKIFSADFEYHIPGYQRPYAWTEEETGILFDDLYEFFQTEAVDNYFLGSIVLIKDENKPYADVIDGQQRLTTLSILFSVMANSFHTEAYRNNCKKYLQEEGNILEGIAAQPRIFLRDWDQDFFSKYIQDIQLDALVQIDPVTLDTEAKRHIQKNCTVLREKFSEVFNDENDLLKFTQFILTRCFLVVVSTPNQESAFRVFSVMNSRGLDLLPTDIIKSMTIGKLPKDEEQKYTEKWEELENLTGRDGFNEVFTHTRTIFAKERPKKNLLDEFKEYVIKQTSPKSLVDEYLIPYTEAYVCLKNCDFSSTQNAEEINELLLWLNKTNNHDWMPPAIKFLTDHKNDSVYILWFIRKLERLASYLLVTAKDVNQRMERYKWILVEMESRPDNNLTAPLENIELTDWEKQQFIDALNGEIYSMTAKRRNYIIQRLDSFLSDGGATYNTKLFTIEHVLPQHPSADSEWMKLWPDTQTQRFWLNKIANLVPLTRQRNSAAQNYDFNTKKIKYFQSKNGTSSYTLTTQVINIAAWTPEVVEARQKDLEEIFISKWDLKISKENSSENPIYKLAGRGGNASGYSLDGDNFVVMKGSHIAPDITDGLQTGYLILRNQLIADGMIVDGTFKEDYTFTSVSAAAVVILGRSANGRTEWTKLDGRTFAQVGH
ncbi:DUF4357 domain-containing protein [Anthropogastromicrobium aceti]|uniref:DUF4357 domain-containing protein n=1 Tax=Anthropogastromicrobium aceti TaxID=2981768 RepID=UPI0008221D25|nr:DUF4357 domain-containing protein [Anthropogastromicrobium aceti]MCU6782493.1 DUF4357 domain-containing protein [Anthropogastromicrobium aceti]SCI86268.1 Uncharacterized conserved protein [uncultured Lachnospira sp.]